MQRMAAPMLVAAIVATTAGCADGRSEARDLDDVRAPDARDATGTAADGGGAAAGQRGSGTLRLGDATYEFAVRACDVGGETDDTHQTITGRGTLPDGATFDVFVSRNEVGGLLVHTVSFQTGNVMRGEGRVLEAQRMRQGARWGVSPDEPDEPLVRISGDRVRAEGRFAPPDPTMPGTPVHGVLEATCRR